MKNLINNKLVCRRGRRPRRPVETLLKPNGYAKIANLLGVSGVSLRLGLSAALTTHCVVIHYRLVRFATSRPTLAIKITQKGSRGGACSSQGKLTATKR